MLKDGQTYVCSNFYQYTSVYLTLIAIIKIYLFIYLESHTKRETIERVCPTHPPCGSEQKSSHIWARGKNKKDSEHTT